MLIFNNFKNLIMDYSLDSIVARAKRRAFAFPGSDIYG
jgi:hypothetical protein